MKKTENKENVRKPRKLEELNLIILGRTIRKVKVIPQKNILGIDTDKHGIRLDAYIEEVREECELEEVKLLDAEVASDIYDIEPNNRYERQLLPKRMRYYHGLIDTQFLAVDMRYDKLPNVVIITILPYDPFEKGRMVYTIQNQCVEDGTISYQDGAKKIFLYTKGTEGNPSQELRDMLKYMEKTTEDNVTNQDIANIHKLVRKVKWDRKVGISYMKSWERENIARDEGRIEGRIETILELLGDIGEIPSELEERIAEEENREVLKRWTKLAARADSIAEFEREM